MLLRRINHYDMTYARKAGGLPQGEKTSPLLSCGGKFFYELSAKFLFNPLQLAVVPYLFALLAGFFEGYWLIESNIL